MILDTARELQDYVITLRRDLHSRPELSGKEFETQKRLMAELDQAGIPYTKMGTTSIVATINKGKKPVVALRADIDALPILEQSGVDFASENEGVMHACGHDAHSAMLMGAARILQGMKNDVQGEVRLLFQEDRKSVV